MLYFFPKGSDDEIIYPKEEKKEPDPEPIKIKLEKDIKQEPIPIETKQFCSSSGKTIILPGQMIDDFGITDMIGTSIYTTKKSSNVATEEIAFVHYKRSEEFAKVNASELQTHDISAHFLRCDKNGYVECKYIFFFLIFLT